ncbi:MAG: hypothetical protein KDC10_02460 [Calditrichaeota bacterium]|nr:hypothetical protein [Calditrichota bacterium]
MRPRLLALGLALSVGSALALDAPVLQIDYTPAGGILTLSWDAIAGAEGYQVFGMHDPYGSGSLLATLGPEATSMTVAGVNSFFYVVALGQDLPEPAPVPTGHLPEDVTSVFSNSFPNLAGTDFNPWWGQMTLVTTVSLSGNDALQYANFNYQGTQLASPQDLSLMEFMHVDVYTADETSVNVYPISISTGERPFNMALTANSWNSFDIDLDHFRDLGMTMGDIHQLKFDGGTNGTIYLDNIYFWKNPTAAGTDATLSDLTVDGATVAGFLPSTFSYNVVLPYGTTIVPAVVGTPTDALNGATALTTPAGALPGTSSVLVTAADMSTQLVYNVNFSLELLTPSTGPDAPTVSADSVFSIYSDVYVDLAGTNFSPYWGQPSPVVVTVDLPVGGENVLRYQNLSYQGTNLGSTDGGVGHDVSAYGYLHMDVWSANASSIDVYMISLSSGERVVNVPVVLEEWNSVNIPLSQYTSQGLLLEDIHQFKIVYPAGGGVVYFDNWYFAGVADVVVTPVPETPAPAPGFSSTNVISLFSDDIYDPQHPVDTWSAVWDQANLSEIQIAGNDTKLYENLVFAGIEFTSNPVDASAMTHFHLDFWTPDDVSLPAVFRIKLVDFGANGVFGGGDDTEHELTFDANSTPALASQGWVSFDIDLDDFAGMINRGHIAQLIISGSPDTVYIDNVLFHN